jgi:uncharacterized Zn-binding protein involved in type VI secretion
MAFKPIIRLGDRTSHGGTVVEAHQLLVVHGQPVAGVGHQVDCPRCSGTPVIEDSPLSATFMGVRVAVHGMKTSCGATLIASQQTATVERP